MLIPEESDRIEDRRTIANIPIILRMIKCILASSTTIDRVQREREARKSPKVYSAIDLFLMYVLMQILDVGFDDVRNVMRDEWCEAIGLPGDRRSGWRIPRGSSICEFKRDCIEKILDELTMEIATAMMDRINVVRCGEGYIVVSIDSTPAQASRYNFDAEYNGHYRIRMDKMHIIMIDGHPLFMIPTGGNTGDNEVVEGLMDRFNKVFSRTDIDRNDLKVMADGGYDSFRTFNTVYRLTSRVMNCHIRETAVLHPEASWEEIQKRYGRMHKKKGYDPFRKDDKAFVLDFLNHNGQEELVGMYLRD